MILWDQDTFEIFHKSLACSTVIGGSYRTNFRDSTNHVGFMRLRPSPSGERYSHIKVLNPGRLNFPLGPARVGGFYWVRIFVLHKWPFIRIFDFEVVDTMQKWAKTKGSSGSEGKIKREAMIRKWCGRWVLKRLPFPTRPLLVGYETSD